MRDHEIVTRIVQYIAVYYMNTRAQNTFSPKSHPRWTGVSSWQQPVPALKSISPQTSYRYDREWCPYGATGAWMKYSDIHCGRCRTYHTYVRAIPKECSSSFFILLRFYRARQIERTRKKWRILFCLQDEDFFSRESCCEKISVYSSMSGLAWMKVIH